MKCPKCGSINIDQYRMMTGKIWCGDCGFTVPDKEIFNPFVAIIHNNTKAKHCSECGSNLLQPAGTCTICRGCGATIGACG